VLTWWLARSWLYRPVPIVPLALLAFGAVIGASEWLALRGWSSVSRWWLLVAPLAGFGAWFCGLIFGSVMVMMVLASLGSDAAGWTFILMLPVAGGLATLAVGAAQWRLMRLDRPEQAWWLIMSCIAGTVSVIPWLFALFWMDTQAEPIWTPVWRGLAAGLTYGLLSGVGFLRREGQPPVQMGGVQPIRLSA
jgi:hypothetical protein